MKKVIAGLLLHFFAALAFSQTVSLEVKGGDVKVVKVDKAIVVKVDQMVVSSFPFTVNAPSGSGLYFWTSPSGFTVEDQGETLKVTSGPNGSCTFSVKVIGPNLDKDGKFIGFQNSFGSINFNIGGVDPPPPPVPPTPPVPPAPPPNTKVIPLAGMHVLIVYDEDTSQRPLLSQQQSVELYGADVAAYLNAKCAKDGTQPGWRIWRKSIDLSQAPEAWRQAMGSKMDSLPWIIISDAPNGGIATKLPDGGILDLLRKYGG